MLGFRYNSKLKTAYGRGYEESTPYPSMTTKEYGAMLASYMIDITLVNALGNFFFFNRSRSDDELFEFLDGMYSVKGKIDHGSL